MKTNYFPPYSDSKNKIEVQIDLPSETTKANLKKCRRN